MFFKLMTKDQLINFNMTMQRSIMTVFRLKNKNCNVACYYDRLLLGIKFFFSFSYKCNFPFHIWIFVLFFICFPGMIIYKMVKTENFTFCISFPVNNIIHFISWSWPKVILHIEKEGIKKWLIPWAISTKFAPASFTQR